VLLSRWWIDDALLLPIKKPQTVWIWGFLALIWWVVRAIALSVVLAALNNLLGFSALKRWRLAFVFGLIHGFGFASVLLDLGLPASALLAALGGFNIGVEIGQLAIVAVFLPLAWTLRHTWLYRWVVVVGGSTAVVLLGSFWTLERVGWLG